MVQTLVFYMMPHHTGQMKWTPFFYKLCRKMVISSTYCTLWRKFLEVLVERIFVTSLQQRSFQLKQYQAMSLWSHKMHLNPTKALSRKNPNRNIKGSTWNLKVLQAETTNFDELLSLKSAMEALVKDFPHLNTFNSESIKLADEQGIAVNQILLKFPRIFYILHLNRIVDNAILLSINPSHIPISTCGNGWAVNV